MKDDTLSRARRITDRRTAAVFSDPLRRRLVLTLAGGERSLGELADSSGLDLKRLHYHVMALKKLGLITITRKQRRAGRPIKFYRAVADAFFVPEDMASSPPHAALNAELRAAIANLRDPALEGMLYHLGEGGELRMRAVHNAPYRNGTHTEIWQMLRLSRADAVQLAHDIENCLKSFADRKAEAAKPYLVHFAFAPRMVPAATRRPLEA